MCKNSKNKECNSSKAARFLKGTVNLCLKNFNIAPLLPYTVWSQSSAKKFLQGSAKFACI